MFLMDLVQGIKHLFQCCVIFTASRLLSLYESGQ